MTEDEAKKILKRDIQIQIDNKALPDGIEALEIAIKALEEVQKYKTIDIPEKDAEIAELHNEPKNLEIRERYKNDFLTFKENKIYNKALDDLMQKIVCDRTLLDGWQLRAIQRKTDQLKKH